LLALVHGGLFGAAAKVLPWDDSSSFGMTAGLLAAAHLVLALGCLFGGTRAESQKRLAQVWRGVSFISLALLLVWAYWTASGATYLVSLYGGLGQGLAAAAAAAFAPVVLFTLPFGLWGVVATRGLADRAPGSARGKKAGLATLALASCFGLGRASAAASTQVLAMASVLPSAPSGDARQEAVQGALVDFDELRSGKKKGSRVYIRHGIACASPLTQAGLATALVVFQDAGDERGRRSAGRCVQAPPGQLFAEINEVLRSEARRDRVKIDLVTGAQSISSSHPTLDGLKLRPGLDGVCAQGRCLAPWQLVAADQFTRFVPISFIADLRIGTDAAELGRLLDPEGSASGGPVMSDFLRIETESFVVGRGGEVQRLVRGHPPQGIRELNAETVAVAVAAAAKYIVRAQGKKGRFRYKLDPFTGKQDKRSFNLPRQAGTTFALCEYGADNKRTNKVIARSLRLMARRAREHGDMRFLTKSKKAKRAFLGETALPLIAFARCRHRVGPGHDELMGAMARGLLALQDQRGVFATSFDRVEQRVIEGPETLFAEGQAIFALSMIEKIAGEDPSFAEKVADIELVRQSVDRAMQHYASEYWDHPLAQFFWIEENWHCLAARASLDHHRHDGYERMCLDYNRYKMRLSLDEGSGVAPEFLGAYGFGNVIAPHNTASAGLGEGLAAAIEIAERRGEDSAQMRERMRAVQRFLLAQQWLGDETFALNTKPSARGGWSESMVSPTIRIDFVQHAMAALASGQLAIEHAELDSTP
jgi:hypothetical protein